MSTAPKTTVDYADVVAARKRIADGVYASPCPESAALSELTGCRLFCKLDYLQRTGSFKERGARNALKQLDDTRRAAGVIAASAGNHALALAYHGKDLGIPVTVVMPRFAPLVKVSTCRHYGANVVLHGEGFGDAVAEARRRAADDGLTYIHGFDDPAIIAGQGTMGLELLEQVPNLDAVIVPIGGGGLVAGVALAIKENHPDVEVIGVEAEYAAGFKASLDAGHPVPHRNQPTLADGLAVNQVGDLAFAVARDRVDRLVLVGEDEIALAILRLIEMEKGVVEGAAASTLAALIGGHVPHLAGKRVAITLCGGNIDPSVISRVIEKGLVADGRMCRFTATISDRPGGLAKLATVLADAGASVKEIIHDRAFSGPDVAAVNVLCVIETRDAEHAAAVHAALADAGIPIVLHQHAAGDA
ncbi:MAG: threonine ammonia-lyase [Phycisphaera sp.]|nr:threonine ammonia-lyase [Phycisphaera sp.]